MQLDKELDREEQAVHIVVIKASDNCDVMPDKTDSFDSADDSLLKVVVNVKDINDNPPIFTKSKNAVNFKLGSFSKCVNDHSIVAEVFTGGLTTEADFGLEVLRVTATDLDADRNALLSYHIRGPIQSTITPNELEDSIGQNPFIIDRETGAITLNFDPQKDMKGYFDMEVIVRVTCVFSFFIQF